MTLIETDREPGLYPDVPELEYHRDPAFSQSQAKVLRISPAKYKWQLEHPEERDTAAFDKGKVAHAKVLGIGTGVAIIPDSALASNGAATTTKAKEFIAEARSRGLVPLKSFEMAEIDEMALALEKHDEARELLAMEGRPELSMWWDDPGTGIRCRGRIDYHAERNGVLYNIDYKSTADAGPSAFARSCADYGYHVQGAAYEQSLRVLTGADLTVTKLIAQEKKAPYFVAVYTFAEWDLSIGLDKWHEALRQLAWCRENDEWPGYAGGELVMPSWS